MVFSPKTPAGLAQSSIGLSRADHLIFARFFFPRIFLTVPKASLGANTKDRLEAYATLHRLIITKWFHLMGVRRS